MYNYVPVDNYRRHGGPLLGRTATAAGGCDPALKNAETWLPACTTPLRQSMGSRAGGCSRNLDTINSSKMLLNEYESFKPKNI